MQRDNKDGSFKQLLRGLRLFPPRTLSKVLRMQQTKWRPIRRRAFVRTNPAGNGDVALAPEMRYTPV